MTTRQEQAEEVNADLERRDQAHAEMRKVERASGEILEKQMIEVQGQRAEVEARGLSAAQQEAMLDAAKPVGFIPVNYEVEPSVMAQITDPDIINRAVATAERDGSMEWASAWKARQIQSSIDLDNAVASEPNSDVMRLMNEAKAASDAEMAAVEKPMTDEQWEKQSRDMAALTERQLRGR